MVHALEFTIEGRSGSTTVRFVHSGFLGDDWESEYEALTEGDAMYLHQLADTSATSAAGPVAIIEHFHPGLGDRATAMTILRGALGIGAGAAVGDTVRLEPAGLRPVDGSVDYVSETMLGAAHRRGALPLRVHPDGWGHLPRPPHLPR